MVDQNVLINVENDGTKTYQTYTNVTDNWALNVTGTVTTSDPANGTPGSAVPSRATFVGGTDGTNLRGLLTDTSGNLFVRGTNAAAAAIPTTGLMVGGSDGTNYRFLSTDSGGRLQATLVNTSGTAQQLSLTTTDTLATTASSIVPTANSVNRLWNGTNFSRAYQISAATGVTGTGVTAVATAGASTTRISTATTTTVKSGAGICHEIVVGTLVASATITVYDNTSASGTILAVITLPSTITSANPFSLFRDRAFATGLTIVTSGATDLSVSWR